MKRMMMIVTGLKLRVHKRTTFRVSNSENLGFDKGLVQSSIFPLVLPMNLMYPFHPPTDLLTINQRDHNIIFQIKFGYICKRTLYLLVVICTSDTFIFFDGDMPRFQNTYEQGAKIDITLDFLFQNHPT